MLIRIDIQSKVPLFEQIAAGLRRAIADGSLVAGGQLPTARALASGLGLNIHTVLRAYQILCDEGLLTMRRGRGATVIENHSDDRAVLIEQVRALAGQAKRLNLGPDEVAELIKGVMA